DPFLDLAAAAVDRYRGDAHPSIPPVGELQPVLTGSGRAVPQGVRPDADGPFAVLRMNRLEPAGSEILLTRLSRELLPLGRVGDGAAGVGTPDDGAGRLDEGAVSRLFLLQRGGGSFAFRSRFRTHARHREVRADPRNELARREGLDQVVVGAELETL